MSSLRATMTFCNAFRSKLIKIKTLMKAIPRVAQGTRSHVGITMLISRIRYSRFTLGSFLKRIVRRSTSTSSEKASLLLKRISTYQSTMRLTPGISTFVDFDFRNVTETSGLTSLQVIKACQSLTSRGYLKTQFSWQWVSALISFFACADDPSTTIL